MKCHAISLAKSVNKTLRYLFVMLWVLCPQWAQAAPSEVAVERIQVTQPRGFGYQLGDLFERRLHLQLRHPYKFVEDSLPRPGRLNRWIAFHSYNIDSSRNSTSTIYEITLRYQVANVETTITDAGVPSHQLSISNDDETLTFLVPPTRTIIAPFGTNPSAELAAEQVPSLAATNLTRVFSIAAVLLISLAGFWWLQWGRFRRKGVAPFHHCYHEVRKVSRDEVSAEDYANVLREVHQAFNLTAGRTVFPENLPEFFRQHHSFQAAEAAITQYFDNSNSYFFGNTAERLENYPLKHIRELLKLCCKAEREKN